MPRVTPKSSAYFALLLRVWCHVTSDQTTWRIMLEDIHTGERTQFKDLATLMEYMERYSRLLTERGEHTEK